MKQLFIPVILMASCAMVLSAQSDTAATRAQGPAQKQVKPEYVALNECIGAKVSMKPGAEARNEAAEAKETVARPSGEITDLLIEPKTGRTEWAVISFGGLLGVGDKTVVVPASILQWNSTAKSYDADVDHDQVKALTAFDAKQAKTRGLDEAMTAHASNWRTVVTAAGTPAKVAEEAGAPKTTTKAVHAEKPALAIAGTSMVAIPTHLMCASEVDDYPLYARSEQFGTVSNCVVDRANGTLAFVIVGHGGLLGMGKDQYLLPFSALQLAKRDEATVLVVDKSMADLTSSVKYVKPEHGIVDAEAAKKCCAGMDEKTTIGSKDSR